eukprot:5087121-Pleurochrysis_carterae.AAC.1
MGRKETRQRFVRTNMWLMLAVLGGQLGMLEHERVESREELLHHKTIVQKERIEKTKEPRFKMDTHRLCATEIRQWQQVGSWHKGKGKQMGLKQTGRDDKSTPGDQHRRNTTEQQQDMA